jgi:hypothetical protein
MTDCSFPLRAARRAGRSTICVKSSPGSVGADGTQVSSQKPRHVENEAIRAIAASASVSELQALHVRLVELERIAAQPDGYKHVRNRPARALYGLARYRWIGGQIGMGWREVQMWLDDADAVLALRIAAGMEG